MLRRIVGTAAVAVLLGTGASAAQNASPNASQNTGQSAAAARTDRMAPAPNAVMAPSQWRARDVSADKATTPALAPAAMSGQSIAFMLAGGALFVAGVVAGGDAGAVMMLGGAGIGAYGIYLYFR